MLFAAVHESLSWHIMAQSRHRRRLDECPLWMAPALQGVRFALFGLVAPFAGGLMMIQVWRCTAQKWELAVIGGNEFLDVGVIIRTMANRR
jgi:hypothetical protein